MTNEEQERRNARLRHNDTFVRLLYARRPELAAAHRERTRELVAEREGYPGGISLEATSDAVRTAYAITLETIVLEERPVLFVKDDWIDTEQVALKGLEALELVEALGAAKETLLPVIPLVGRIDVTNFPGTDFVGTGWFVDTDVVVTNRHVASLIARWDGRRFVFRAGVAGHAISGSLCTGHEFDDISSDPARTFAVEEVLYIESDRSAHDIAFLRVTRRVGGESSRVIAVAAADAVAGQRVVVVGYPARAPRSVIPNQDLMKELYRDRYDVKRAAPGLIMPPAEGTSRHDCTTLGGNSGSVVLDLATGKAVGLHFAGLYQESNYAMGAAVLAGYVSRRQWQIPVVHGETHPAPAAASVTNVAAVVSGTTVTIPISITVTVGSPPPNSAGDAPDRADKAEASAVEFWSRRPEGVLGVRVGFSEEDRRIGDIPFVAVSVEHGRLAEIKAKGPSVIGGFEVRYFPADLSEVVDALRSDLESVGEISYDDDARTGESFSFDPVHEEMSVLAHVGPEYSWDTLEAFLNQPTDSLVSAMYEFHGKPIADAIERRLEAGTRLSLILDNASFTEVKKPLEEFDRVVRFEDWKRRFGDRFERIVAPEGRTGLISDSYHIKVTVRDDDTFWLSSGNWKMGTSQPVLTQAQRDQASDTDLPGNREWHVVVGNPILAQTFRSHIKQDIQRSRDLGGGAVPVRREGIGDVEIDVPILESALLERRAPSMLLPPKSFKGRIKAQGLLTPDQKGAVYSDAVLELIGSARKSLLFQIPYISMPSKPGAKRGYIDELIEALTAKLKTLEDARVILSTSGSGAAQPTYAAWYFKAKGVNIDRRLKSMDKHHTKGMIVDGRRVLVGSHNWSKPGVTLNRDASLIFDHQGIAEYFASAFEIDWTRANPIKPKVPSLETRAPEGDEAAFDFRRMTYSELMRGFT